MVPAAQIVISALLFSLGLIEADDVLAFDGMDFTSTLLSVTAFSLGTLMLASFVVSRIAAWIIRRS